MDEHSINIQLILWVPNEMNVSVCHHSNVFTYMTLKNQEWTLRCLIEIDYIIGTNLLTNHVFQPTGIIFEVVQDIIGMNLLTKFHEDRTVNVASKWLTRKIAPPLGSHTNLLTKFHEDWAINVASRVLTRFYYSHLKKNTPPPGGHVCKATKTIFKLIQDIIGTNLLTKFHDDRKINVTSRMLTRKNAPLPWSPYIIRMNLLTEFHEDRTINVASRVLTRFYYSHIRKNAPPLGSHVFHAKVTIFELIQIIIGKNLLSKFHEDRKINVASRVLPRKNAPPPGSHVFQPTGIIFKFVQDIIGMNLLTKFHEDRTINKNAPPNGSHVFQANVTIFKLIQDIIETNLLTKFHED
ncbi:hypothetical protein DPMN_135578 [Dreissena polymorpha]|uniref:Uncharacterized protein n=1 Tax=Dreissena polymorpha TaxID=45954 RepID=A0A9D4JFY0_DREPO|nr:hypothetical protein DPMN_135578 [Dreissena polymorpha]